MTKVRFYLRQSNAPRVTSIFMMVHFGAFHHTKTKKKYLPLKYSIGESISPAHWNTSICRARERTYYPHYTLLNIRLRLLENMVLCFILDLKNRNIIPTRKRLQEMLDTKLQRVTGRKSWETLCSFTDFMAQHIEMIFQSKAIGTINQYRNTLRILNEYSKETGRTLEFEDINMEFHANFRKYMHSKGYTNAYLSNQIRIIRTFMNEATELGYNKQTTFKSRKFSCPIPEAVKIYLTEAEINKIQHLPIDNNVVLSAVRDLFIIGCHTGLRYSDLIRLNPANFNEKEKLLRIITKKTNDLVYIPLRKDMLDICKRYNYTMPHVNNMVFNSNIKQIACMAGIEDDVERITYTGGHKKIDIVKKYKLISAHTARRSFATNAFLANVPTIAIMRITGHRTEKSFMKYIRITGENNARQLLSHPHFSNER
jgi:integrase